MILECQANSLEELNKLAESKKHSILIEGFEGTGKTYLAMRYAEMLKVTDFQVIEPKVSEIKESIDSFVNLSNDVVVCIENLDTGMLGASYTLLKFLEEPKSNIYIVVTCRNIKQIPDTIISRCVTVPVGHPTEDDLKIYSCNIDPGRYNDLKDLGIWPCITTFVDLDKCHKLTLDQLNYFKEIDQMLKFNKPVSDMSWKIGHFKDNSETPINIIIRYIMKKINTPYIHRIGIECLDDLTNSRIASHAVLSKFLFDAKYCE